MNSISKKVYSNLSLNTGEKNYVGEVASSDAYVVNSYTDLVKHVAKITFNNPEINIYFRGQGGDFRGKDNKTQIFPTLYRLKYEDRNDAIQKLHIASEQIINKFTDLNIDGVHKMKKYPIVSWSVLQHYEVCDTPLLDVTDSLIVACSFALTNREEGYLYLLGLPHSNGSITFSTENELFNIKLNSICPPDALRAYYQSGYLVGDFPNEPLSRDQRNNDFSKRLIAKFKLIGREFWNDDFRIMPSNALFPQYDDKNIQKIAHSIKTDLLDQYLDKIRSIEKREKLKQNLYSEELKTEVLKLFMNDWNKEEIVHHLENRGFDVRDIENEYREIVEILS